MELTDRKYNPFFYKNDFDVGGDDYGATLLDYFASHAPPPPDGFVIDFDKRPDIIGNEHHGERSVVEFLLMQDGQWHHRYSKLKEYINQKSGRFDWEKLEGDKPRKGSEKKKQASAFLDEIISHMEEDLKWNSAHTARKLVVWRWAYAKLMLEERWKEVENKNE